MQKVYLVAVFLASMIASGLFFSAGSEIGADSVTQLELAENIGFSSDSRERRNLSVIMISIETLRADHMPCYGYYRNTTPNLCGFGKENIIFNDALAQATWTIPSEASVFTGQYPTVHGLQNRSDRLSRSKKLLAERMPEHYEKVAFTGGMDMQARYGFDQGFDQYKDNYDSPRSMASFNETIPLARNWMDENSGEDFFLFIGGYDPHSPYSPPEPYRHQYSDNYTGKLDNYTIGADIRKSDWILDQLKRYPGNNYSMEINGTEVPISENDVNYTIDRYDGSLSYTDELLGNFLEDIKERGMYEDTMVIVYSNHGEALNDHVSPGYYINGHRRAPFKEQIQVPLMMHIPEKQEHEVEGPVGLIDIYPTVTDVLGVEASENVQGKSLLSAIKSGEAIGPVFSEGAGIESEAVIADAWKYLYIPDYYSVNLGGGDTRILLNRSKSNPENVYSRFPDVGKDMQSKLKNWRFSNIQFGNQISQSGTEDVSKQESENVQVSPKPPNWWNHIDEEPKVILKSDYCETAQLAMGNVVSPSFEVCLNEGGFRDKNYSREKPSGTYRIIALGDAVTFGVGVNNSQTWPNSLEDQLNNDSERNFQVLNFGLPFKSTSEEVQWFQHINGSDYEPDTLVIQYMENDAENLSRISQIEKNIKSNLSENLSEDERNRLAVKRAIEIEREEREAMPIEKEMETVDPYFDRLNQIAEKNNINVLVMYYATQFSERHVSYIRNASQERGWDFMVSDLDSKDGSYTYSGTFNLKPEGHTLTAKQVEEKLENDIMEEDY